MTTALILVITVVAVALIFDFFNGFHDAANAISTLVISKTLTPLQAVLLAGLANFAGYFIFGVAVAKTIGTGIIDVHFITLGVLLAGLLGAILWNIITWLLGLPTSSSHALIGGLVGAAIASTGGFDGVIIPGLLRIVAFIFVAPLAGMLGAVIVTTLVIWISHKAKPEKATRVFRKLQLLSSTFNAIGHGSNDAQKSMGIIAMALVAGGINQQFQLDNWVILACYFSISLGTMFGGWRIVRTMGTQITKIRPLEGLCADTASALTLTGTAHFGIPVSTTHVIAGSIMGVGAVEKAAAVRWVTARKILWAWLLTIPLTGICAAASYFAISFIFKTLGLSGF